MQIETKKQCHAIVKAILEMALGLKGRSYLLDSVYCVQ